MKKTISYVVVLLSVGVAGGCSALRGELSDGHDRAVEERIRDIDHTSLHARTSAPVETVEDHLAEPPPRQPDSTPGTADDVVRLSIADLRLKTLRNNLDLDVALVAPALADTRLNEEAAKFDPTLVGGVRYKHANPPALDGDLVGFTSDDSIDGDTAKLTILEHTKEELNIDAGIEIPLPTGGKVKLLSVFDEQDKLEPARFEQFVSGMKFSISQPLLRNGGIGANTASISLARLNAQAARAKTKLSAIRVLVGAEKAYWKSYEARKILEVRREQYNAAYDNLELVRKRVAEGLSPRIEIVRAEVGVAARLESLIVAGTRFRLAQRDLKRILNRQDLPLDSLTVVDTTSQPQIVKFQLDAAELVDEALANRMELLEVELDLEADALRIELARNRTLPRLDVNFEYGILDRQSSFGSAWKGMWDFDNSGFSVGVRGEIPLTNDARESRLRQALLKRSQRLATRAQKQMTVRQDVHDALDVLDQNWQRILAARQNVIVSGVNYEAELKQFTEGLRTMREVLEALATLGDAQLREVRAIVGYQEAQINLAYVTGTLLAYDPDVTAPLEIDYEAAERAVD